MRPLRLKWRLSSPMVASAYPIHLDALVAYAATEEALRNGASGELRALADDLPLAREARDGTWVWQASAVMPAHEAKTVNAMRLWTRRFDAYDYADRVAAGQIDMRTKLPLKPFALVVDTVRGLNKNHFQHIPVQHIDTVCAWCVGDLDRLVELLAPEAGHVQSIGPRGRMGFGRIREFEIDIDETAREKWALRVLPWEHDGGVPVQAAYRPPYWAPENRAVSYVRPELFG